MKTLFIVFALTILSIVGYGQKNHVNYVLTDTDTLICKNMSVRTNMIKCVLLNGEKVMVPNKNIVAYSYKGKTMKKLPVYINGERTDALEMMEFIANYNRVKVYKYTYYNELSETQDAAFNFYHNQNCITSQTNLNKTQIKDFLIGFNKTENTFLTAE